MRRRIKSKNPALGRLVKAAIHAEGLTFRQFADRAVDPISGYRMSHQLVHDISEGCEFKVSPRVLRALAAGANKPWIEVQAAAAKQFIDLDVETEQPDQGPA